jgi:hypothetical protein
VATLLLHAHDDVIVQTTLEAHGVVSPLVKDARTRIAKNAADAATVRSRAMGLIGAAAAVAIGDVAAELDDLIVRYSLHLAQAGVHATNDTSNLVAGEFRGATTLEGLKRSLAEVRQRFYDHITNNDITASPSGIGTGSFHSGADWAANPKAQPPNDILSCRVLMADLWRCFELHRASSAVHDAADTANGLAALGQLDALHRDFVAVIASLSPTVSANESSAASLLVNAGFTDQ